MNHTPGPWIVELNNPLSPIEGHTVKVGEYPHRGVCIVPKGGGTKGVPTQLANARLIAAAPDLLDAMPTINHPGGKLVKVVAHYESGATQTIDGDVVTQAVRKAVGS